ncbi:MAG: putative lipid II flippase FtsW [Thermoanaerobaculia bacterium]|nr:putative lipid II flippase FtsW [Thermoanaerobaculia bacterium]
MSRKLSYDRYIFGSAVLILVVGLVMIYSASAIIALQKVGAESPYHFLTRQLVFVAVGATVMFGMMHIDISRLRDSRVAFLLLGAMLVALVLVLFQPPINNTHRWFRLGPVHAQPSELAKLVLILFLASQLAVRERRIDEMSSTLLPIGGLLAIPVGLIFLQPDFGTAAVICAVAAGLFFAAGLSWKRIMLFSVAAVPVMVAIVLGAEYRRERILAFLHPEADPLGSGFQAMQSLIALGTGGMTGLGIGNGRQKLFFLPEPHTDFIFAIVGEELGFVGAALLILLFALLVWRGARVAWSTDDAFIRYAALGITLMIGLQALINTSVALALLPTKGLPLPLVSYGGSSLITNMAAVGLLLNLSQHTD